MKRNFTYLKTFWFLALLLAAFAGNAQDWQPVTPALTLPPSNNIAAMAADAQDVPYIFTVTSISETEFKYFVQKYTAAGWAEIGGDLPLTLRGEDKQSKMRIAADGTVYLLCGDYTGNIKVFKLAVGGSWQQLGGNFSVDGGNNTGSALELDAGGVPYIAYTDPTRSILSCAKYTNGNWQPLNTGQPAIPPGTTIEYGILPAPIAIGGDGTLYTLYQSYDPDFNLTMQLLSLKGGVWKSLGSVVNTIALDTYGQTFYLSSKPGTSQLNIYGPKLDGSGLLSLYYDGTTLKEQGSLDAGVTSAHWYTNTPGTAYVAYQDYNGIIHFQKFDGSSWDEIGTPFASSGQILMAFASNPIHLYAGFYDNAASAAKVNRIQIGKFPQTITFPAIGAKTYGDADFAFVKATSTNITIPITYTVDHPEIANLTADNKSIHILKAGTVIITAHQAGNDNYNAAADVPDTLVVKKAVLTVNAANTTKVVNQPLPDLPYTFKGWIGADSTVTGVVTGKPTLTTTATQSSPAGTYPITVAGITGLSADNYSFAIGAGATLMVNTTGSTPQTITFAALPAAAYGNADVPLKATTNAPGLSITYTSSNANVATIVNGNLHITGAGTVTITASQPGDPTYAPAADVPQTLTVNPAALTITADDKTINRGEAIPALTAKYTGFVNGDDATKLTAQPNLTTMATATSAPGVYDIVVSGAASQNYAITNVNGHLTIIGTQLITWNPISAMTYGDAPFTLMATSDAGTTPVYSTDNPSVAVIDNGKIRITGAGTAIITATFPAKGNFVLTTAKPTLTVQPKALSISADNKTRSFGAPDPLFTLQYSGFVNNDNNTSLAVQPVAATTATAASPVGNYPINISGASSPNYIISYVPGTLTVTAVARTLSFNTIPARKYGDADFNPGATASTGETPVYTVADPNVGTVTSGGQVHINGAGTTTITATFAANSSYTGANTVSQTLTVSKVPLTITAENKTRLEGGPPLTLTAVYSGLVNGDTWASLDTPPALSTTAKENSPTGNYPINVSGAVSKNYDISYINGTLSIVFGVGQDQLVVHPMLSPNGDGKNDFLLIDGIQNYPDNHITVVNRNGAKVYEAKGYDNGSVVFTGKNSQGNSLVAGTYYYEINYALKGNTQRKAGYVIIKY